MGFLVNARDATLFVIHCSSGYNENVSGNVNSHLCNFHSIFKSYSSEIILRFLGLGLAHSDLKEVRLKIEPSPKRCRNEKKSTKQTIFIFHQ